MHLDQIYQCLTRRSCPRPTPLNVAKGGGVSYTNFCRPEVKEEQIQHQYRIQFREDSKKFNAIVVGLISWVLWQFFDPKKSSPVHYITRSGVTTRLNAHLSDAAMQVLSG